MKRYFTVISEIFASILLLMVLTSCRAQIFTFEFDRVESDSEIPYSGMVVDVPIKQVYTKTSVPFLFHVFRYRVIADKEQVAYAVYPRYDALCPNGGEHNYKKGCVPVTIPINLNSHKRTVRIEIAVSNEAIDIASENYDLQDDGQWSEWSSVYEGVQEAIPAVMEPLYKDIAKWTIQVNADGLMMPITLEDNSSVLTLKSLLAENDMPVVLKRLSNNRIAVSAEDQFHGVIPLNNCYISYLQEGDVILTDDGDLLIIAENKKNRSTGTFIGKISESGFSKFMILKNSIQSSSVNGEIIVLKERTIEPIDPL